jgi:hypothetical protein
LADSAEIRQYWMLEMERRQPIGPGTRRSRSFERRQEDLLPTPLFLRRLGRWAAAAGILVIGSLAIGIAGYHFLERLPWIDSFLNASMILGGMGPVDTLHTSSGKIFASFYALYSGLAIIGVAGLLMAPIVHRFLHKFHLPEE